MPSVRGVVKRINDLTIIANCARYDYPIRCSCCFMRSFAALVGGLLTAFPRLILPKATEISRSAGIRKTLARAEGPRKRRLAATSSGSPLLAKRGERTSSPERENSRAIKKSRGTDPGISRVVQRIRSAHSSQAPREASSSQSAHLPHLPSHVQVHRTPHLGRLRHGRARARPARICARSCSRAGYRRCPHRRSRLLGASRVDRARSAGRLRRTCGPARVRGARVRRTCRQLHPLSGAARSRAALPRDRRRWAVDGIDRLLTTEGFSAGPTDLPRQRDCNFYANFYVEI